MPLADSRVSVFRLRRLTLTCGLVGLLLIAACNDSPPPVAKTPSGKTPPRTQFPMPPAQSVPQTGDSGQPNGFTLLDNSRQQLSNYAGEVVVLDFYATWCPPCREETPHLVELHKRYGAQGLRIIGLNVGGPDDRDKVPDFSSEYRIPYALGFPDPEMTSLYLSDDDRIPQAFVFDRKGKLVKRFVSYDETMPAELERVIKTQLAAAN
ncbi:MAG TPA: redoxin domain-containing protein [Pyrinomonadaceae bacterium]|jgi:cytochrome c biogenesis protein CcmG/thiol:disulfide interchange protein DsbE